MNKYTKNVLKNVFLYLIMIVIFAVALYTFITALDTPEARYSYSTGECVEVLSKHGEYDCDNLPESYSKIWVR